MQELMSYWPWFLAAAFAAGGLVARVEYVARRCALAHTRIDKYKDELGPCLEEIKALLTEMRIDQAKMNKDIEYMKKSKEK